MSADGPRAGRPGDVDGGGRRLPRPPGAGRLVAGVLHFAGREPGGRSGSRVGSPAIRAAAAQLSRPGTANSRIRVGGYLGFAASLNTALRGNLGNTLVMQVRAQRPSYWVGETFDTWQGQNWTESQPVPRRALRESSPFVLPISLGDVPFGQSDLQTFYVANPTANLVFHAESASELWFPAGKVYVADDGTIVSPLGLGTGSIYTVDSQVSTATPAQLRADDSPYTLPAGHASRGRSSCRTPTHGCSPWPRSVTAGDTSTYDEGAVADPLDRRPHPLLGGHPTAAGRRRHGRRVPLRQPSRILRADLDVARGDAALPRHPRPRGRRVRAGRVQPDHRPLPGARQRRPRLGPGVVPRLRVAGLRPDGVRAARPAQPGRDGVARRRAQPCAASRRCPWPSCSAACGSGGA